NDARHSVVQIILDARRPQWIGGPRSTVRRLDARGTDPALGAERDVEVRMSGARHARGCIAFHAKSRRQDDTWRECRRACAKEVAARECSRWAIVCVAHECLRWPRRRRGLTRRAPGTRKQRE